MEVKNFSEIISNSDDNKVRNDSDSSDKKRTRVENDSGESSEVMVENEVAEDSEVKVENEAAEDSEVGSFSKYDKSYDGKIVDQCEVDKHDRLIKCKMKNEMSEDRNERGKMLAG